MENYEELANDVAALEQRVADLIFEAVRAQMKTDDSEGARQIERHLSRVRRSLQKAEHLLRRRDVSD